MGSLTSFLATQVADEASNFLEKYAQEEFLEEAIAYDMEQEVTETAQETEYESTALSTYYSEVVGSSELPTDKLVKAALIPRTGEQVPIINFMFNPTELNMSRDLQLNETEGARTLAGLPKISFGFVNPYSIELSGLLFDTYETGEDVITKYIDPIRDAMDFTKFGTARDFVTTNSDGSVEIDGFSTRGSTIAVLVNTDAGQSILSATQTAASAIGITIDDADLATSSVDQYDDYADIPMTSKRPPVYYFIWGSRSYMMCFIQKINYKLTMFLPNGVPVRAIVDLSLQEVDMRSASRRYSMPQNMTAS